MHACTLLSCVTVDIATNGEAYCAVDRGVDIYVKTRSVLESMVCAIARDVSTVERSLRYRRHRDGRGFRISDGNALFHVMHKYPTVDDIREHRYDT